MKKVLQSFLLEIREIVKSWRIWLLLGWQDIRLRYRRSYLGPFWITLSMALMIYSMGLLYGGLFHMDLKTYFPFIAGGLLAWNLISTTVIEATNAFMESACYLKQIKLPHSTYILRILTRNYIIFFHNIIAILPLIFFLKIRVNMFLLFGGLFITGLCCFSYGMIIAMLGARFRDVKQIIISVMQIIFLVTPIMWMPQMLPQRFRFAITYNPFQHLIEIVRSPIIGQTTSFQSIWIVLIGTVIGWVFMSWLLLRAKHRVVFWI